MTTPNEELRRLATAAMRAPDSTSRLIDLERACTPSIILALLDQLQSQAERIKKLEFESSTHLRMRNLHYGENGKLRDQLAAIAAAEPVSLATDQTDEFGEVIYREVFTRPMPAQRLTELKLLMLTTAYEQGVGKGIQRRDCNPYAADTDEHAAWKLGYEEGLDKPMPAQDVTELVELLEFMWRDVSMNEYAFEKLDTALSKYKGAK